MTSGARHVSIDDWLRRAADHGIVRDSPLHAAIRDMEAARDALQSNATPIIGIFGEFSRGKSALINALLGAPIMPVHPLPTTAVPTYVTYNAIPSAWLVYADHETETPLEEAQRIVARRTDLTDGLRAIRVGWPHPLLERGVMLLDTPGIGALDPRHRELALSAVDQIALMIFVFAADPPLSDEECAFLRDVVPRVPRMMLVQTKIDALNAGEQQAALDYNRSVIDSAFPQLRETPIFAVSALRGDGIDTLRGAITALENAALHRGRVRQQVITIRSRLQHLFEDENARHDAISRENARRDAIRRELAALQRAIQTDDSAWREELFAVLDQLETYVLGNLSALIYKADPAELSGKRGTQLILDELHRTRERIADETERVLQHAQLQTIEALRRLGLSTDALPPIRAPHFPEPTSRTTPIRVQERRLLPQLTRVNAEQTVSAYRAAARRTAEEYAIQLTPLLTAYLDAALYATLRALNGLLPERIAPPNPENLALLIEAITSIDGFIGKDVSQNPKTAPFPSPSPGGAGSQTPF